MPWTRDRKKKYRILLVILIPFLGACILFLLRDPLAASTRGWRSHQQLSKAKRAMEREDEWKKAFHHALVARQLNPQSIDALRILMEAAYQARETRTLFYAEALFSSPQSTTADKLRVLQLLQEVEDHVGFVRLYNLLPREIRGSKEFVLVRARFLIERNANDAAKALLEGEIENAREREYLLMLASLLLQPNRSDEEFERGQELIAELASSEDSDEIAEVAFQLLGAIDPQRIDTSVLGDLGARAIRLGNNTAADYIAAANLAIATARRPESRREIIEEAIATQGQLAPAQLAAWLRRIGESDEVLSFLTPEKCREIPELYQERFHALIESGRIDEASEWLRSPPIGLETINIWLARAQLNRMQEKRAEENNAWEQAFQVAEVTAHRNEYLRIFDVAQNSGRVDLATRAILKAPSHPNGIMPPASDAVRPMVYLSRNDRLEDLRFLTEALVAREPDNEILVNNLIYLNFLLGDNLDASMQSIENLVEEYPEKLSFRTTWAIGLLLAGQDRAALEALPGNSRDWASATSADHAIRALALERNGESQRAESSRKRVDRSELNQAEIEVFFGSAEKTPPANPRVEALKQSVEMPAPRDASHEGEDVKASKPEPDPVSP